MIEEIIKEFSLSELIKKCGYPIYLCCWDGKHFYAYRVSRSEGIVKGEGKSFEEATAELWLKLNDKQDKSH